MTNKQEPTLRFDEVNFSINDTQIIQALSGSIANGKITTLVGPSGAGKTTLLKLCNGLLSPTSGDIYLHSQPLQSYDPLELRRLVGFALQAAPMIRGTVYDNLALPLVLQGKTLSKQAALQYLEDVGLEKQFLHQQARELSGGQRQKVSIARTLINESNVLLLDEITSALDRTSLREIEELITMLNKQHGVTIIWITHNLDQALSIGHHTWVMMDGELIESGDSNLLKAPKTERVKQFIMGETT